MTEIEKSKTSLEKRSLLAAKRFLERKGFEILATEYRCDAGTVDIVALNPEDSIVSFVDVSLQMKTLPDGQSTEETGLPGRRSLWPSWQRARICSTSPTSL